MESWQGRNRKPALSLFVSPSIFSGLTSAPFSPLALDSQRLKRKASLSPPTLDTATSQSFLLVTLPASPGIVPRDPEGRPRKDGGLKLSSTTQGRQTPAQGNLSLGR